MTVKTVIDNLKNTIAGKEMLLATYENPMVQPYPSQVKEVMVRMLEINITELKRILTDLEQASTITWNQYNCPFTEQCHRIG